MSEQWWRHSSGQVTQHNIDFSDVPVVVIDPANTREVDRLIDAILDTDHRLTCMSASCRLDEMTNALREFAAPTPPKPVEPCGLGAVVEDADGEMWLRWADSKSRPKPWCVSGAVKANRDYAAINAVRVLSEGVTP